MRLMQRYRSKEDILILEGAWSTHDIPQLLKIMTKYNKVQIDGIVSNNIMLLINQHNTKINKEIHDFDIKESKESFDFIVKIFSMQWKFLKKLSMNSAQKEAFKNYFVTAFLNISVNSLFLVSMMSAILGVAIVLEGYSQLYYLGVEVFTMHFFVSFIFREMIPVMTAILLASKCGTSITANIAGQKINSELKMLNLMNIGENIYLKPKWIASVVVAPLMNIYALFFAILCGTIAYSSLSNFNLIFSINHMLTFVNMPNFIISQVKSVIFGWWIGLVMCAAGVLYSHGSANIGKATIKSIVYSVSGIIIFDLIVMFVCTKMGV